jgi:hypothetical protein
MVSQAEMNQVHNALTQITNELNKHSLRISAVEADKKGTHQGGKPVLERILASHYKPSVLSLDMANRIDKFREWSLSFKDFLNMHVPGLGTHIAQVEVLTEPNTDETRSVREHSHTLFQTLLISTGDGPRSMVRQTNCGVEAWRQLHQRYDPQTPQRDVDEIRIS